jgi:TRAP-type C4-dicarboxylate transport system substrate-binding protein
MKTSTSLLTAAIFAATLSSAAMAEKWDMPMAYSDSNFHTQNGKAFAEAVTIATSGKLEIIVHGGGSLFKGNEIKRAIQTGQAPIGERLLSAHQNEEPLFGMDSIPFLATSYEASDQLWKIAKPQLEKLMDKQNLVLLYSVPWPAQGLYFKKEINSVADAKGIKFRGYNAATNELSRMMGMNPVQIEAAELVQALATGVAEGFVSSGSTGYDRKVWEHLTHFYDVQAWLPRNYVFANKDAWNDLDKSTQNIVKGVAMMAEAAGTAKSEQLMNWYLSQLAANGMKVQPPGNQLKGELDKIGAEMTTTWIDKAGSDGKALVDAFNAMQ